MSLQNLANNSLSLPIEISGWDAEDQFFVEKSDLDWSESGQKTVFLRHPLRISSIVFVRLLVASGLGKDYPTPHQVEDVQPSERAGASSVRLVESRPRVQFSMHPMDS